MTPRVNDEDAKESDYFLRQTNSIANTQSRIESASIILDNYNKPSTRMKDNSVMDVSKSQQVPSWSVTSSSRMLFGNMSESEDNEENEMTGEDELGIVPLCLPDPGSGPGSQPNLHGGGQEQPPPAASAAQPTQTAEAQGNTEGDNVGVMAKVKQLMVDHESVFRNQVSQLHKLVDQQRQICNEIRGEQPCVIPAGQPASSHGVQSSKVPSSPGSYSHSARDDHGRMSRVDKAAATGKKQRMKRMAKAGQIGDDVDDTDDEGEVQSRNERIKQRGASIQLSNQPDLTMASPCEQRQAHFMNMPNATATVAATFHNQIPASAMNISSPAWHREPNYGSYIPPYGTAGYWTSANPWGVWCPPPGAQPLAQHSNAMMHPYGHGYSHAYHPHHSMPWQQSPMQMPPISEQCPPPGAAPSAAERVPRPPFKRPAPMVLVHDRGSKNLKLVPARKKSSSGVRADDMGKSATVSTSTAVPMATVASNAGGIVRRNVSLDNIQSLMGVTVNVTEREGRSSSYEDAGDVINPNLQSIPASDLTVQEMVSGHKSHNLKERQGGSEDIFKPCGGHQLVAPFRPRASRPDSATFDSSQGQALRRVIQHLQGGQSCENGGM